MSITLGANYMTRIAKITGLAIVVLALALGLAPAMTARAAGLPSVTIGSAVGALGDNITIPVVASAFGNAKIGGVNFIVNYDVNLFAFKNVSPGKIASPSSNASGNRIVVLWYDATGRAPLSFTDGDVLFNLNFEVISRAGAEAAVKFGAAVVADQAGKAIPANFISGTVVLNGGPPEPADDTTPARHGSAIGESGGPQPPPQRGGGVSGGSSSPPAVDAPAPAPAPNSTPQAGKLEAGEQANLPPVQSPPRSNPPQSKQVKGAKAYSDGSLLRGKDKNIYVITGRQKKHIKTLAELRQYAGQKILDVASEDLIQFPEVLGRQTFKSGTFIRGRNGKVYRLEYGKKKHIKSLAELRRYAGQKIFDVGDDILAQYPDI